MIRAILVNDSNIVWGYCIGGKVERWREIEGLKEELALVDNGTGRVDNGTGRRPRLPRA